MPPLRKVSGKKCLKILCNKFGFKIVRQRGSHVLVKKESRIGKTGTVIPMHDVLKIGTLKAVLQQAAISEDDFGMYI